MLQVTDLKKVFKSGDTPVTVDSVNFKVADVNSLNYRQKWIGQSTLPGLLGALDKPTSGSIKIGEKDITKVHDRGLIKYRCKKIGFIFQTTI